MRSACRILAIALVTATTSASPLTAAEAKEWRVVPARSEIVFEYEADGEPAEGSFGRFSGMGTFDPAAPAEATLELRIRTESIDLGDAKASAFATSAEWFDSANHPEIVYRLESLARLEGDRYRAEGTLTIRGRTRPVTTTVTLEVGEREAHASGTLTVNRKDYGLGVGPMSLFVDIGPQVSVRFDLTANPVR